MITLKGNDFFIRNFPFCIADTILTGENKTFTHKHNFYEFFIMKEGSIYHNLNGKAQKMSGKSLCFILPEDIHFFLKEAGCKKATFTNIAFSREIFHEVKDFLNHTPDFEDTETATRVISLSSEYLNVLHDKINLIQDITNAFSPPSRLILFKSLLVDIMALFEKQRVGNAQIVPSWLSYVYDEMKKEENYCAGIKRFIAISGKSQEHLTRYFKKYYKLKPTEYINLLRLYKVTQLLVTTEESILDIAYGVGFESISHFNQLFKKQYGVNPASYRRLNKMVTDPRK